MCILKFKKLKILYLHGNCISDLNEIYKLKPLKQLRSVTFHGNPIANHSRYRSYIVAVLPQVKSIMIANLDFSPIVQNEKKFPAPPEVVKKMKEAERKLEK
ncbi:hypothetical protein NQ314_013806 [Rhamnusium bicolor]|uniref:Leucine-rich repeat-containing protein 51 n=1 Tax=Rhamnusium bicolor TaxID=1586634 RepID=A0AAV8X5F1_9CUCU|nr:hypothetical protein NQ314_013806 [Rhamnusium bicolor]